VSEGLLEFRKGIGTFVRRDVIAHDVRSLVSFTEKARAAGKRPSTELLAFEKLNACEVDSSVLKALSIDSEASLWEMNRIRLADQIPVIYEHRFVVHAHCPKLTRTQAQGSLYRTWTKTYGLKIAGASEVIRAVLLNELESTHLQAPEGSAALEVVSVGFLENDLPLWWERTLYRGDQYEFHSRVGPIQSATPARGVLRHE
jgi:GntR family transcriptional regulator